MGLKPVKDLKSLSPLPVQRYINDTFHLLDLQGAAQKFVDLLGDFCRLFQRFTVMHVKHFKI